MNAILWSWLSAGLGMMTATLLSLAAFAAAPAGDEQLRKLAQENYNQGNFKDAYEGFRKLALDPQNDPRLVGKRPEHGRPAAFSGSIASTRSMPSWKMSFRFTKPIGGCCGAAAQSYMNIPHQGFIVAGKF